MRRRFRFMAGHLARRHGHRLGALTAAAVLVMGAVAALGYFLASASATGSAKVDTLNAPTISSATPGAGTVALAWSAVPPPSGSGTVTYSVTRDGGTPAGDCPTSASPTTVTSCTDSGLAAGSHQYTVTARWRTWTATSSTTTVNLSSGAATKLVLSAAATSVSAGQSDNLTITAKDAANNTVTAYTGSKSLTFSGASTIGANNPTVTDSGGVARNFGTAETISFSSGVATVSGGNNGVMKLYKAETANVVVSDGTLNNGTGLAITVSAASAAQLAFTQQPSNSTGGTAFATQPKVTVQDLYGNTVTTDTSSVTLAIGTNPSSGALTCTTNPVAASSGVATFAGCKIDKAGTGYTLTATDGALTSATSSSFNITVGAAAKLAFTQQPAGAFTGVAFTTQPRIAVQDAGGNTVTTDTSSITLAIGTNPGSGTLSCTTNPLAASAGVATFAGCKIDKAGTGYTLTATDGSLTAATSAAFDVTASPLWVANGATATWTGLNGNTQSVPLPTSPTVNDLMLLIVVNTNTNAIGIPTGWTSVGTASTTSGAGIRVSAFYRFFQTGVSAPSVTFTADTGGGTARIVSFRYVNTTTPLDGVPVVSSTAASGSSTFAPTGLTTGTANARAESIVGESVALATTPTLSFSNAQSFAAESGFPQAPGPGVLQAHGVDVAGRRVASAGAVTFPTFSTNISGTWAGLSISLRAG